MSIGKILIVDDDKNICELLRLYMEKDEYEVVLSHNGEDAVVKFAQTDPDLVLLDIMLPGQDGWQVCREIRKKSNAPIIMITAKGETFDKVLGLELGADEPTLRSIVKNAAAEDLLKLKAALQQRLDESLPMQTQLLHSAAKSEIIESGFMI